MDEQHDELEAVPLLPPRTWKYRRAPEGHARPVPATRAEAELAFRPALANAPARGRILHRLNMLGLVELRATPGPPITRLEAHELAMDAAYGPEGV